MFQSIFSPGSSMATASGRRGNKGIIGSARLTAAQYKRITFLSHINSWQYKFNEHISSHRRVDDSLFFALSPSFTSNSPWPRGNHRHNAVNSNSKNVFPFFYSAFLFIEPIDWLDESKKVTDE